MLPLPVLIICMLACSYENLYFHRGIERPWPFTTILLRGFVLWILLTCGGLAQSRPEHLVTSFLFYRISCQSFFSRKHVVFRIFGIDSFLLLFNLFKCARTDLVANQFAVNAHTSRCRQQRTLRPLTSPSFHPTTLYSHLPLNHIIPFHTRTYHLTLKTSHPHTTLESQEENCRHDDDDCFQYHTKQFSTLD